MDLQEKYLPVFDVSKAEQIVINSPISKVFPLIKKLDFSNSKIIYWLFKLRGIAVPKSLTMIGLVKMGFIKLEVQENKEVLLGLVGKFWTVSGNLKKIDPEEFKNFNEEEFAKTTWNFKISEIEPSKTKITTETRVFCPNHINKRKFKNYWNIIQPFSSLIRREILKCIRQQAENNNRSNFLRPL